MAVRVPNILADTLDRNPDYANEVETEIRLLKDEIENDALIRLISPPAADYDLWAEEFARREGDSWLDTEWFYAEMLAYRRLLEACRYSCCADSDLSEISPQHVSLLSASSCGPLSRSRPHDPDSFHSTRRRPGRRAPGIECCTPPFRLA